MDRIMRDALLNVPTFLAISVLAFIAVVPTAQAQTPPDIVVKVIDVNQGSGFGNPSDPIVWNGQLFFAAKDGFLCSGALPGEVTGDELGEYGEELFTAGIDGIPILIKDINTATSGNCDGVSHALHEQAAATSSHLIFRARNNPLSASNTGIEPWKTNGTGEGTELVKDIANGSPNSLPQYMVTVLGGGHVAFRAETFASGREPWLTDGTAAGTSQIADLAAGDLDSDPRAFTPVDATKFVFVATDDGPIGEELYVSDGTSAMLLADIGTAASGSDIGFLTPFVGQGKVVFLATDPIAGREPWVSDGTPQGTFRLADINPGSVNSNTTAEVEDNQVFTQVGNLMFFAAGDAATGPELWVTDGTAAGTRLVKELFAGPGGGYSGRAGAFKDLLYFGAPGIGLWTSDGTTAGTQPLIPTGFVTALREFTAVGELLYFTVGTELWVTDGTVGGTVTITDAVFTQAPRALTAVGDAFLAFVGRTAGAGEEMFVAYRAPETIGPTVSIGFTPIPVETFEDGALTATANDENTGGSNIAGIEFQLDGGAWSPLPPLDGAYDSVFETGIQSVSFASEGSHQACVRATDALGNLGEQSCMDVEVVTGDSTPPLLTQFDVQPNAVEVGETAVLSVQASDATTGNRQIVIIEYQADDGPWESIIPPVDGAYDEATEEGEVELAFDTVGTHGVCVRAADAANNVSVPECLDVSVDGPVGLLVKCLHEPLYPQTGEEVVIRARALDRDGNTVLADRVEIYLNDRAAPFDLAEAATEHSVSHTADGEQFLYGCAAERGDETAFSRFASVDVGEPQLSDYAAIPVLYHGRSNEKIDLVFMADADSYPGGPLDPDFLEDMQLLISDGLFEIPWFVEHQWALNIWLARDVSEVEPKDPDKDTLSICKKDKPAGYRKRYAFADAVGIIHQEVCRDNWIPPGPFTTRFDEVRLQVVAHEIGHAVFLLSDEYTTAPTIRFTVLEFPNLLATFEECQVQALARGKNPDECRQLPGALGGGLYIFEPDYNTGPPDVDEVRDLMQQTGAGPCSFDAERNCARYRVGDSEEARVKWKLGKCTSGGC